MLVPPIARYDDIDIDQCNRALVAWCHKMGPIKRLPEYGLWCQGLFIGGDLAAVTVSATLIRDHCCSLSRAEAIELARVCAARPDICRLAVRLWREAVLPQHAIAGRRWAVSYQDAVVHSGNLYRFDGWIRLGFSSSGTDLRSGARGRRKVIWGWCADRAERSRRAVA